MKIALVWPGNARLVDMSVRLDLYHAGLVALGHDAFTVCLRGTEWGFPCAVITFKEFEQLRSPDFWQSLGADLVLMITWNRMSEYLEAARQAAQRVIAIADTDGQASGRLFPRARVRRDWAENSSRGIARMRPFWHCIKVLGYKWRQEDAEFIRSTELSERVLFGTEGARHNFSRCLALHGRDDLIKKLRVVPYPIDSSFLTLSHATQRRRRAIAIGRWSAQQKNAGLLAESVERYYRGGGDWEIITVGKDTTRAFSSVAAKYSLFSSAGALSPNEVAGMLNTSRVLLCSSRWEGAPVAAFEALASGCTLVTTPLPATLALIGDGQCGTSSASHRPGDFLRAMWAEFSAWDRGLRLTDAFSGRWRERLHPQRVCEECLAGI